MKTTRSSDWQELCKPEQRRPRDHASLEQGRRPREALGRRFQVVTRRSSSAFQCEDALTAFNHPFAFAAERGVHFGDALSESIDLQLQS